MIRAFVVFLFSLALGLLLGWYGGADWSVRSSGNALNLAFIMLMSAWAACGVWMAST